MQGLKDKRVVVAGGATGIGAATAKRLAAEGAQVVIGDLNAEGARAPVDAIKSARGTAAAVAFDMADDASCKTLIKACVDAYGFP